MIKSKLQMGSIRSDTVSIHIRLVIAFLSSVFSLSRQIVERELTHIDTFST